MFASIIAVYMPSGITYWIVTVLAAAAGLALIIGRAGHTARRLALIFGVTALACGYTLFNILTAVAPVNSLSGETAEVTAIVTESPGYYDDHVRLTVKFEEVSLPGAPDNFKGILYCREGLLLDAGDRFTAEVTFRGIPESSREYYYAEGIYISASLDKALTVDRAEDRFSLYGSISGIRNYLKSFFYDSLNDEEAALLTGISINDKSGFTDEMSVNFKRAGLSHIVAVSGMHLSIIAGVVSLILSKLRLSRRMSSVIMLPVVLFIMAVAGFTPSVIRAGIMVSVMLIGGMFFRKSDSLSSLGAAAIILIAINPLCTLSVSFQLSFAATAGLIILSPEIDSLLCKHRFKSTVLNRMRDYLSVYFSVSAAATVFTLPVAALRFESVSVIAPISNTVLLSAVSVTLVTALLAAMLAPVAFLSRPLMLISGICCKFILAVSEFFGNLSVATVSFAPTVLKLALAAAVFIVVLAVIISPRRRTVTTAMLLSTIILLSSGLAYGIISRNDISLRVFSTDEGISAAVSKGRECMLIGSGDRDTYYQAESFLENRNSRSYKYVLLPDMDDTFGKGSIWLINSSKYDMILAQGEGRYRSVLRASESEVDYRNIDGMTPFGGAEIQLVRSDGGNGVLLSLNGLRIFVAEECPADVGSIADIVICLSAAAENTGDTGMVILCGDYEDAAKTADVIQNKTDVCVVGESSVQIDVGVTGKYNLKRVAN